MGASESSEKHEEFLERAKATVSPHLRLHFPGFDVSDEQMNLHIETIDYLVKSTQSVVNCLLPYTGVRHEESILETVVELLHDNGEVLLNLKIEGIAFATIHPGLQTELATFKETLQLLDDPVISNADKADHLTTADRCGYKLVQLFADEDAVLFKNPFEFTPFLVSFTVIYVPIVLANYWRNPTELRAKDLIENIKLLKEVVEYFEKSTILKRMSFIKAKPSSPGVRVFDYLVSEAPIYRDSFWPADPKVWEDVMDWYAIETIEKYFEYFGQAVDALNTAFDWLEIDI